MDQDLKTKWLAALRSGEYKQIQGALKDYIWDGDEKTEEMGYCCLGVLSKIATGDAEGWRLGDGANLLDENECGIPEEIQEVLACMNDGGGVDPKGTTPWYGLIGNTGKTKVDLRKKLPGKDFAGIADWIEENL